MNSNSTCCCPVLLGLHDNARCEKIVFVGKEIIRNGNKYLVYTDNKFIYCS